MSSPPSPAQAAALLQQLPLNGPILEIFLNGLFTCLLMACLGAIWMSKRSDARRTFWSAVIVLLYSCSTIHSSVSWEFLVLAFQNHGTSPALLDALIHPNLRLKILALIANVVGFVLADVIMIWRCWVVWGRSWVVVVLPILATIAGIVCVGLGITGQIAVALIQNASSAVRLAPLVRFNTPFLGLSLGVTLYTTGFIVWRIIQVQRYAKTNGVKRVPGDFFPVLELLIESSALYSASLFVYVVLQATENPNQTYPESIHAQIAGIAPTLLIFRVSIGHARKEDEWTSSNVLKFASTAETSVRTGATEVEGNILVLEHADGYSSRSVDGSGGKSETNNEDIACPTIV
ncbi:hypothetical protein C8R47DRAFT_1102218 [Mycena vitilis]|nr:hypothetical protein C8R47DRAFT_1102218 [Mycena vitilis]